MTSVAWASRPWGGQHGRDAHASLALALLLIGVLGAAEVTLDLPDPLIPGAVMSGTLVVRDPPGQIQDVSLPPVGGLEWNLSNQNSSRYAFENGKRSSVVSIGLVLRAAQIGTLAIPPVTVRLANGASLASAARTVRVDQGDSKLVGEAIATCSFDPPTIVPGQPTNLIYRLSRRVGEKELNKLGIGPPEGAILLGDRTDTEARTNDVQGREWLVQTFTWPMTHATPGTYQVGGQQEYLVALGDGFFNTRVQRRQIAVPAATLTVENLPAAGRPDGFDGLIGPLSAVASLDRERVAAGEGAVLSVTVSGRQSGLAKRPALSVPGAQCYPKDESAGEGSRTFRWDVVPAAPGQTQIHGVRFPYFDPASRSYRSADTGELLLTVIPGRSRDLGIVGQARPADPVATPAIANTPSLPAPLRGQVSPHPASWLAPAALAGGTMLGLVLALGRRLVPRRAAHRGRAVRAAGRDPAALAAALANLRPALTGAAERTAADALQAAVDRTRFGNQELPDIAAWVAVLEVIP